MKSLQFIILCCALFCLGFIIGPWVITPKLDKYESIEYVDSELNHDPPNTMLLTQSGVSVGDVWIYKSGNPFNGGITNIMEVIALKDGYVQYIQDGDTLSSSISLFKIGAKKMSKLKD